ncbi:MAG: Mycinamicin III 3''-O-methyltransferase [Nitrospira sp.]|nr:Mycinamicin III 3''-O-methyltransferase [Nitrospira sp.]
MCSIRADPSLVAESPERRYLHLLKAALSFTLWPEPPAPLALLNSRRSRLEQLIVSMITRVLWLRRLQLVKDTAPTEEQRRNGEFWPSYADTMIGLKRLDNVQHCMETVIREGIPGDVIETGVWRGGACIFMRAILAAYGVKDRVVYVADSFQGLPPSEVPEDAGDTHHTHPYLSVSQEQVAANFQRYGLLDDQVVFLKGWFKDTLPTAPIDRLAILRLDGDMYASTMDALNALYSKLSPGGFCIIDDYGVVESCKQAVTDFRAAHGITADLHVIDSSGRFWRRSSLDSVDTLVSTRRHVHSQRAIDSRATNAGADDCSTAYSVGGRAGARRRWQTIGRA